MGPKMDSKTAPKRKKKLTNFYIFLWMFVVWNRSKSLFWCHSTPLLTPILEPHFGTKFAQEATRWAQEGHQELQRPKSCIFKNLKKPLVFQGFWVLRPPKRASRDPRRPPKRHPKSSKKWPNTKSKNQKQVRVFLFCELVEALWSLGELLL